MTTCKSCGAFINWAKTENGNNIPIDAQTVIDGNIKLENDVAIVGAPGSGPYVSHLATCVNAKQHRKPRRGTHDE